MFLDWLVCWFDVVQSIDFVEENIAVHMLVGWWQGYRPLTGVGGVEHGSQLLIHLMLHLGWCLPTR